MSQEVKLGEIKKALSSHFGSVVTVDALSSPNRSKTVAVAKSIGVLFAKKFGYGGDDIAQTFGYASAKSVSNTLSAARKKLQQDKDGFANNANAVGQILGLDAFFYEPKNF